MEETKQFVISKQVVKIAFDRVKANKGTYGIDKQIIADFEENLKDNLYKIWNQNVKVSASKKALTFTKKV